MTDPDRYRTLDEVDGILHYTVLDLKGSAIANSVNCPTALFDLAAAFKENKALLGRTGFKYAVFECKNKNDILFFNIGKACLGVVKQRHVNNDKLFKILHKIWNPRVTQDQGE